MTEPKKRIEELQSSLITKEKAYKMIEPFESCEEIVLAGKSRFGFHPDQENMFLVQNQGREFTVTEPAFAKISRLIGVPESYVRKTPKELLFPHLDYWLDEGNRTVKAFIKTKDVGGRPIIAGFAREDAYYYPVSRVFEQIDKVNSDYCLEGLDDISWRNTTFGVIFPGFEFEIPDKVKTGDWVYGGVKIRTSLIGEFATKISAFIMTLACLNGMVSVNEVYTFNRKQGFAGQDVFIVDGVQTALGVLSNEVERVRALKEIVVEQKHISQYVNHVFDQLGVNQRSRLAVLEEIVTQNPLTLYDLMNAVTSATHHLENRSEVYHLQTAGGYIVQHAESCSVCHRPF